MISKKNEKKKAPSKKKLSKEVKQIFPSPSPNDPLGSYTGKPIEGEVPTQDADDL